MSRIIDLTGKKFGRLTVIEKSEYNGGYICWLCKCECGNTTIVRGCNLKSGHTKSCGCLWKESISKEDISGMKFGRLTAIERIPNTKRIMWRCICDCGNETTSRRERLFSGEKKSCGCLALKHGKTNTRLHRIWCSMRQRCYDKNCQKYYRYGARGITICEEWKKDFATFYEWAINNGYKDNLSINRINNDKGYYLENCHWATNEEQMNNYSRNHLITYKGETKTIHQWSKITKIKQGTLQNRIAKGWDVERALTEEVFLGKNQTYCK